MTGWRAALRLARRDALRHKANSALVLVLIMLPVLAVTAASVIWETRDVDSHEGLDRRMGAAQAHVQVMEGATWLQQAFDPEEYTAWSSDEEGAEWTAPTLEQVREVLGDVPAVAMRRGDARVTTDDGAAQVGVVEVDLSDPLTEGLFRIVEGRVPSGPAEVVVTRELADNGLGVGAPLRAQSLDGGTSARPAPQAEVVGVVESTTSRTASTVVAPRGTLALTDEETYADAWLIGGDAVSWDEVQDLNALGLAVASRSLILDPPPVSALHPDVRWSVGQGMDQTTLTVVVLIVVMVLIEVVLLAGPAFAVGARRHARTLALLAASGGTPAQARRVVMATAVVLGSLGTLLGVVLGVALGAALLPVVQRFDGTWFGPFQVPLLIVAGVSAFGLVAALFAAAVPAWLASRQDPVAVLAGRRGDPRPSRRSPLVGLVVLGLGIGGAVLGARQDGELFIAASAILSVLGMVFLVPVVVVAISRLAGRLPLALRFAARDAARHRTRTVPAVAAVAATVAGVVALGIAVTSDSAENEATYAPHLASGHAVVSTYGEDPDWAALADVVRREAPDVEIAPLHGIKGAVDSFTEGIAWVGDQRVELSGSSSLGGSTVLVATRVPALHPVADGPELDAANRVLAAGGAVAFTDVPGEAPVGAGRVRIGPEGDPSDEGLPTAGTTTEADVEVAALHTESWSAPGHLVLSPEAAKALGVRVEQVGLDIRGEVTAEAEETINEVLLGSATDASIYVERGFQADDEVVIGQLILGGLGALLLLGGTLTATFLALADARADLATLSAVGATPATRRGIAAAYALVIGLAGAVLGALVGAVPGIAISYPLTMSGWSPSGEPTHYLAVPWVLVGVVVLGLPLLTSAIVGLTARSRLPMVARLD